MKSLRPLLSLATAVAFYGFWQYRTLHPATDDAYLKAHIVEVASRVTAPAEFVHVVDNQYVHAGDPLFDLAPATFQARLERARAQLEVAAQDTGASGAQVQAASAALQERQITADHARLTLTRIQTLARRQLLPKQQLDDALATLAQAEAASSTARAELARARNALGETGVRNAQLRAAAAALALSYTHITTPADGWVTQLTLRKGTLVEAGVVQFALVEAGEWWVEANFRESDLTRLRSGLPAKVKIDMYPGLTLTGRVQSLSAGSGATFSLLPPENATGNWVKVTQRFPVRIALDALPGVTTPLRVGASVNVEIDTTTPP